MLLILNKVVGVNIIVILDVDSADILIVVQKAHHLPSLRGVII